MGFFKNLLSQNLIQDEYKKKWAEQIYCMAGMEEITRKCLLLYDKDVHQLVPGIKTDMFYDDNPDIRAMGGKVLIGQMIEDIAQSAKKDELRLKAKGFDRWDVPFGIALGAANLIEPTDIQEKKLFITQIAIAVLHLGSEESDQIVSDCIRIALEENGWTNEDLAKLWVDLWAATH